MSQQYVRKIDGRKTVLDFMLNLDVVARKVTFQNIYLSYIAKDL